MPGGTTAARRHHWPRPVPDHDERAAITPDGRAAPPRASTLGMPPDPESARTATVTRRHACREAWRTMPRSAPGAGRAPPGRPRGEPPRARQVGRGACRRAAEGGRPATPVRRPHAGRAPRTRAHRVGPGAEVGRPHAARRGRRRPGRRAVAPAFDAARGPRAGRPTRTRSQRAASSPPHRSHAVRAAASRSGGPCLASHAAMRATFPGSASPVRSIERASDTVRGLRPAPWRPAARMRRPAARALRTGAGRRTGLCTPRW